MATKEEISAIINLIKTDKELKAAVNEIINPKTPIKQYAAKECRQKITGLTRGARAGYEGVCIEKDDLWTLLLYIADATLFNYEYKTDSCGCLKAIGTFKILCDPTMYTNLITEMTEIICKYYNPNNLPECVKQKYDPLKAEREKDFCKHLGVPFEEFNN